MRKITEESVNAFMNAKKFKKSNMEVEVLPNVTILRMKKNVKSKEEITIMTRDYSRWAKKFDEVAHLTHNREVGGGVECGKFGALLGNNYATKEMATCQDCMNELKSKES